MTSQPKNEFKTTCLKCGAEQPKKLAVCWLCGAEVTANTSVVHLVDPVQAAPVRFSFSLSTTWLLISMAALSCGLWIGINKWAGLVVVLIGFRTFSVIGIRGWQGRETSNLQSWSYFVGSVVVSIVLLVVVAVASVFAFLANCATQSTSISGTPVSRESLEAGVRFATKIEIFGGVLLVAVIAWIAFRFVRDVRKK